MHPSTDITKESGLSIVPEASFAIDIEWNSMKNRTWSSDFLRLARLAFHTGRLALRFRL